MWAWLGSLVWYTIVFPLACVTFIYALSYISSFFYVKPVYRNCPKVVTNVVYPYGVSEMQGRRPYMEDRHVASGKINGNPEWSVYGVFDGHGGDGASRYCMDNMAANISREEDLSVNPGKALRSAFLATDREYLEIANHESRDDGTTAVVALVQNDIIHIANAGDSRAVLIQEGGRPVPLSRDHKPNREDEKKRIAELGGSVVFWGVWRVEGVLAVSRSLGDRMLKKFVTGEPELCQWARSSKDKFVVLASDGVWDVLSNEEVARIAIDAKDAQWASKTIMEAAYGRGSMDNICVLVIDLRFKAVSDDKISSSKQD